MKSTNECVYCYLKQAINCMDHGNIPDEKQYKVLYELMDLIKTFDVSKSPCFNSTISILKTYELIGTDDPFIEEKKRSNQLAKDIMPLVNSYISDSENKLKTALHASSAGNIIDMGIFKNYDIKKTLIDTLESEFKIDHYSVFQERLELSDIVLVLGDNCGEIMFDLPVVKLLTEMKKKVYYAVKSGPILNDALYEDAIEASINQFATVIETGSNDLGVNFSNSSEAFNEIFRQADLIISKGQANFESLDDYEPGY
ncbi:MAG: DUF89 family protein, partial [Clostridia bacterium]|nr:DUF89 family protein [Clostridia bacterium]